MEDNLEKIEEYLENTPIEKKRQRLYEKILDQLTDQQKIDVLKVAAESGLRKDDSALAQFYLMFYINTMYKEIPEVLDNFQETLHKLASDFDFYTNRNVSKNLKQMQYEFDVSAKNSVKLVQAETERIKKANQELEEIIQNKLRMFEERADKKILEAEKEYSRLKMSANEKFGEALKKTLPNILKPYLDEMANKKSSFFGTLLATTIGFSIVQIAIHVLQTYLH